MLNTKLTLIIITTLFFNSVGSQQLISKDKAIALALKHNYGIKIANNTTNISKNNTSLLNSGYLPTVSATGGASFNNDNLEAQFTNGEVTTLNNAKSSRYNASVNINYVLFDGLGRYYDYKLLKNQHQLTELQARQTIENTIFQLFTNYYQVAQLGETVKVLKQTLNITQNRLKRVNYQYEYGQNTKLQVLNAQVDKNNDSISLITQKQNYAIAKRNLNVILGNMLQANFEVDTNVDFLALLNKDDLLQKALTNNTSLLNIKKNITINTLTLNSQKSAFLPTINLTGTYGWNQNNNNQASFLSTSRSNGLSGGINLSWNLFNGQAVNTIKNAKIALNNQELQKQELKLTITRDFNNAWEDYQTKLKIFELSQDNITTATNNFDRTKAQFKLGQISSVEFRQSQLNLISTELSKTQAKYNAKLAELLVLQISGELLNYKF